MQVSFVGGNSTFRAELELWLEQGGWRTQGILHDEDRYYLSDFEMEDPKLIRALYAQLTTHLHELPNLEQVVFPRGLRLVQRYIKGVNATQLSLARQRMPAADRKVALLAREMASDPTWW